MRAAKTLPIVGSDAPLADRFPMPLVPSGWYGLLRSRELPPGRAIPIRALARDWVAFRDRSGRPVVAAAHCPHLGAHLGHGGHVENGQLVCPFHAWCFDSTGRCTGAPGASRAPRVALETLATAEVDGVVFAWYAPPGRTPTYEVTRDPLHDPKRSGRVLECRLRVACHIQELRENVGDESHFTIVHERPLVGTPRFVARGPTAELTLTAEVPWIGATLDARIEMFGPGVMFFRTLGFAPSSVLALTTPIDEHASELRLLVAADDVLGIPLSRFLHAFVLRSVAASDLAIEGRIWGYKKWVARPLFLGHERVQRQIRAWYQQFYES
jgi:nitrite reductase/ring-hydroxylating ferredoxin subunit